ncbi:MAG TPA: hypothetical protein VGC41_16390 [Kofleriaceae bacterium]
MRLCVLVLIAACSSDPTLSVTVTHPDGLVVTKTTVTVYESTTVHCEDIALGRLDATGLEGITTSDAEIEAGSVELGGISRLGTKLVVARGFDANGLLSAGCVEHGEVIGDDSVEISTIRAAVVSIRPPTDPTTSNELLVTLTDPTSQAITDARTVSWTVYGGAGAMAASGNPITIVDDGTWEPAAPTCLVNGEAHVHPNPPSTLGGYAVQVRVAWAVEQPPVYTALAAPALATIDLGITLSTTAKRPCAIRGKQLVCVDNANLAHLYNIAITDGKATATQVGAAQSAVPMAGQNAIALLAVPRTQNLYSVATKGALVGLFGTADPPGNSPVCIADCDDAMVIPACGAAPAKILISNVTRIHQVDPAGGAATFFDVTGALQTRLDNAGCVTVLQDSAPPVLGQFATLQVTAGILTASGTYLASCGAGTCKIIDTGLARGAGVGFTGGTEPRIVASTVDASGVVLVQAVLSASLQAIERGRIAAATIPDRIVAGQLDGDTDPDLFWNMTTRQGIASFEVAYARKVGTDNLEALSPQAALDVEDLEIGDLDGDGHGDVVIVSQAGVAIVPFAVSLPAQTGATDVTCAP